MNVDFSRISLGRGLDDVQAQRGFDGVRNADNGVKPLFSDALTVQERENFQLGDINETDIDEIEKEIVRDDKLGNLLSSHLNWQMPEMPDFV